MNKSYFRFAMSKPSELSKMLTNEGLSCTKAENSPSAYILEKKILKKFNKLLTDKDVDIDKKLIKLADTLTVEQKLNKISSVDRLEKLSDVLDESINKFLIKISKVK